MNITDYKVIEANVTEAAGLRQFNAEVTQALKEGWQPYGNMVSSWSGAGEAFYSQPMVKYEVEGAGSIVDPGDDLLDAAQGVLNNWSGGDLAGAVRRLGFVVGEIADRAEDAEEEVLTPTSTPAAQVLKDLYEFFPGLQDGETDVNGGDLVGWLTINHDRLQALDRVASDLYLALNNVYTDACDRGESEGDDGEEYDDWKWAAEALEAAEIAGFDARKED